MPKASAKKKSDAFPPDPALSALVDITEATLPNGLKVRLWPNHDAPVMSLYIFFNVGSRNERPGITGISHLFEHMMFNGSKKYGPKMFDLTLESNGGRSNAYTTTDMTVYYEDFAAEALETVLDLESDRMRALSINDKSLASEREVVKEERRSRVDNDITGIMDEELGTLVWKAHPYRWPVIGWMGDIDNITRPDCEQYFRTYYAPNNATLYLTGDFEPKAALALLKKYFGNIKKGPALPPVVNSEPDQIGERRAVVEYPAQSPSLLIGYRAPVATDPDTQVLDVIQYALSVGEGSRLTKALVYGKELATSVGIDWTWRIDPGLVMFHAELKPDSKPAEVEAVIYAELEKLAKDGLTDRELQKVKNNLRAHQLRELSTNSGRANAIGNYETLLGDWRALLSLPARYDAITNEQVKAAAKKYFTATRRSVVTVKPLPIEQSAEAQQ
ncbi:MAG: M16 family metallopeptidase [Myxococcaceae bacterium]